MTVQCDVVVVGAGLAGLACAVPLAEAGLEVVVLESADAVGGRVRTDVVDGFRLDRGFQVLSTGYPEVRRVLDLDTLDLRRFDRAMALQVAGQQVRLADPLREPSTLPGAVRAPIGSLRDKLTLAAYAARASVLPGRMVRSAPDITARVSWQRMGLSDSVIDNVLEPFFAGVLLEHDMTTSRRFVDLMVRMFVRGNSAVPARGMQAMPEQLARRLPAGSLHLGARAQRIACSRVDTDVGSWSARAVVVAMDAESAAHALPGVVHRPTWKGVTTLYHAVDEPPTDKATLIVDAESSPVTNTIVLTAAAPSYSSDGRALVSTSMVHTAAQIADEAAVRLRLGELYRTSTTQWQHLATYHVPRALPSMTAPHAFRRSVHAVTGSEAGDIYLCGDYRDTSSIQGALVSGRRAAGAVLADLV